jgi:pentatricopeptide repeat protein
MPCFSRHKITVLIASVSDDSGGFVSDDILSDTLPLSYDTLLVENDDSKVQQFIASIIYNPKSTTSKEKELITHLFQFIKSNNFELLLDSLKTIANLTPLIFSTILQKQFRGDIEVKEKILDIMLGRGMVPQANSYIPLIVMYGKSGNVIKPDVMLQRMKDRGVKRTVIVYNALIKCHGRELSRIDSHFEEMKEEGIIPNVDTFKLMIDAYLKGGDFKKVEDMMRQMSNDGIKPQVATYNSIISAYAKTDKMDQAIKCVSRMFEDGIEPNINSFKEMVRICAKNGNVKKAKALISKMSGARSDAQVCLLGDLKRLISSTRHGKSVKATRGISYF